MDCCYKKIINNAVMSVAIGLNDYFLFWESVFVHFITDLIHKHDSSPYLVLKRLSTCFRS